MWKFCFNAALKLAVAGSRNRNMKTVEISFKSKILVIEMKLFKMSTILVYVKSWRVIYGVLEDKNFYTSRVFLVYLMEWNRQGVSKVLMLVR